MYVGWEIRARNRKIPKAEEPAIRYKLRTWFDSENWDFSENNHEIAIYANGHKINVSFQKFKYTSERNGKTETYYVKFESVFFGWRPHDERAHRELYEKTIQKIRWGKQGFWLQDNTQIPISRARTLRMK